MLTLERLQLRIGQMRGDDMVHNGSWFDGKTGTKIGWGDLSPKDMERLKTELPEDELFVVVGEHESFWELPAERHINPGKAFLAAKARFLVKKGAVYYVTIRKVGDEPTKYNYRGFPCDVITPTKVAAILGGTQ